MSTTKFPRELQVKRDAAYDAITTRYDRLNKTVYDSTPDETAQNEKLLPLHIAMHKELLLVATNYSDIRMISIHTAQLERYGAL